MESQELLQHIVEEVAKRIAGMDLPLDVPCEADHRPGVLVLNNDHGRDCHAALASPALSARYRMGCPLMDEKAIDLDDYDVVLLFDMSCETICRLADGNADTDYLKQAMRAILKGKIVIVIREGVELYHYRETAPQAYYDMIDNKLASLIQSGMSVAGQDELEGVIAKRLSRHDFAACTEDAEDAAAAIKENGGVDKAIQDEKEPEEEKIQRIDKRVLTYNDIIQASIAGVTKIIIGANTLVTDVARETLAEGPLVVVRA